MLRPGGHAQIIGGAGTVASIAGQQLRVTSDCHEVDTFGCAHCNSHVHVPIRTKDTEYFFCRGCMARICDSCADHPCIPFMKKIEAQEARAYRLRCYEV